MVARLKFLPATALLLLSLNSSILYADPDPLADEIAQWKEFVANNKATDEGWKSIQPTAQPIIAKAAGAVSQGRRYYALHLLAAVRYMLAAERYVQGTPAGSREQLDALEAEWKKTGAELQPVLDAARLPPTPGVPAAARAIAEASYSEVRPYYEASLEYARATVADSGYFYLGAARAQLEFARFCSQLSATPAASPIKIQNLAAEMESFEDELLALYKPPASEDSHPMFIRINALLKGARELDSAGMSDGALYRYLDARLRLARLAGNLHPITADESIERAREVQKRLDADPADHSIARLFVEMALTESADTTPDSKGGEIAAAVFDVVLPHYFAALQTPKSLPPKPTPSVTVTLVRWPYT